jgi:hypothetical protein
MTSFEDLQSDAAQWLAEQAPYGQRSFQLLQDFANEFCAYIGAPKTPFLNLLTGGPQNYVQPVAARIDKEPDSGMDVISFEVVPANNLLAKDDTGHWIVGIQLTLDAPPSKFHYNYPIWFLLKESVCEMTIGLEKQKFTFPIEDAAKYKPSRVNFRDYCVHPRSYIVCSTAIPIGIA